MSDSRAVIQLVRQTWKPKLLPVCFYFLKLRIEGQLCSGPWAETKNTEMNRLVWFLGSSSRGTLVVGRVTTK